MRVSQNGIDQIKSHEGLRLEAYLDQVGKPTIGWGQTFYPNGIKVRLGDKITKAEADSMLVTIVDRFAADVESLLETPVNQNQFDALTSFAYNVGPDIDKDEIAEGLGDSTLLKLVNKNPADPNIRIEFLKWNKGTIKGKKVVIPGLTARRKKEADLYFKK